MGESSFKRRVMARAGLSIAFSNQKYKIITIKYFQLSETSADDRGISARIGKPWTTGGDVPVDRLMWQAVCVVGRKLAGNVASSSSSRSSNNNSTCLPVIYFYKT